MKVRLFALFPALLMVGCGSPNVDDPETLDKIMAEAIDSDKLQKRGKGDEKLIYAPNEQTPYTGRSKRMFGNGQIRGLYSYKDGKIDGLVTEWYENGQKRGEGNCKDGKKDGPVTEWYENGQKRGEGNCKDGKLMSCVIWKPNGEKCPVTDLKDGNGITVSYNDHGTEMYRTTYKDGEEVDD